MKLFKRKPSKSTIAIQEMTKAINNLNITLEAIRREGVHVSTGSMNFHVQELTIEMDTGKCRYTLREPHFGM